MTDPTEWTEADLQRLAFDKATESLTLEFKACGALTKNPEAKAEVGKDISAMANAAGGTIVYGIIEEKRVAESLDVGFDRNVFSREWLEQVIDSNVQPRIEGLRISMVQLPSKGNTVAYVVTVPQAVSRAPHQASDGRYYKRANFVNQIMEDYEIRDALRRARWPDLHLTWAVHNLRKEDYGQGPIRAFELSADLNNHSSEPAYYTTCAVYFDCRLTVQNNHPVFHRTGYQKLPDDTEANAYLRQLMLPKDFPIIREQTNRIGTFFLQFPADDAFARFVIGSSIRAPGCERNAYATLIYQHGRLELGNFRKH
jgi:hypothetical protein